MPSRYALTLLLISLLAPLLASQAHSSGASVPEPTHFQLGQLLVNKAPSCGCCAPWAAHMGRHGFETELREVPDMAGLKKDLGIEPWYQSCHTAVSEQGYIFEGHVPAKLAARFLASPPANALGLSVPGMPVGSPGMEMGNRVQPYQVLLLFKDGSSQVYAMVTELQDN